MTTMLRRPVPSSSSSRSVTPGTRSFQRSSPSALDDARVVVRIPGVQDRRAALVVALADEIAFLDREQGALRHRVAVEDALRVLRIHHQDPFLALVRRRLVLAGEHDAVAALGAVLELHRHVGPLEPVGVLHLAVRPRPALRLFRDAARRAADVEGAQRELRARLADALGGQDAHRLAHVHHVHGGQVAAVAHPADAAARLAGQHRADLDLLDPGVVDRVGHLLVDQLAGLDQQLLVAVLVELVRIEHVLARPRCPECARAAAR